MNKILQSLKSRTVWAIVVLVALNGVDATKDMIPAEVLLPLNLLLGYLAAYFRVNPAQKFK